MKVDDDPIILSLLQNIFERRGYEVAAYSNPTACPLYSDPSCKCLRQQPCASIIVSDYEMPCVNGVAFIEALRGKGCRCPHMVLVSVSFPAQDTMERVARLGVRFFAKPLHRDQIIAWLDTIEAGLRSNDADQSSLPAETDLCPDASIALPPSNQHSE
jgi:CheY-like chemotaxis protein